MTVNPWDEVVASVAGASPAHDVAAVSDIFYCFRLLLGRPPSAEEWRGHCGTVGQSLRDVVTLYLQSLEFKNRRLLTTAMPAIEVVELPTFRMYVMSDDPLIGSTIAALRAYEPAVTRCIEARLGPGMTFVDVGANVGYFSLLAASRVGPAGSVYAFEPSQIDVKLLHLSRLLNGFENVEVFPVAAGRGWGLSFYDGAHSNGWVSPVSSSPEDVLSRTVVLSVPIGEVIPADGRIDVIKIDVEGAEFQALTGARRMLDRHHPAIVTEFSPPALESISHVSGPQYLEFLTGLGYRLSVLTEDGPIACGEDVQHVMTLFDDSGVDHIDVLAE